MSRVEFDDEPLDRDEEAAIWCLRLADNRLTAKEQELFDAWHAIPGNAEAFEDAVLVWRAAETAAGRPEVIHARSQALDALRQANSGRWVHKGKRRWYWPVGIAAAILLLVLSSAILLRDPVQLYETGVGERRVAMLDDGSRLSLDAGSEVHVDLEKDRRQLTLLSGRAKFDVAKDPLRPFTVAAGDKLVVATGTSFSVELLGDEVRVLLYSGHVDVLDLHGAHEKPVKLRSKEGQPPIDLELVPGRELIASLSSHTATIAQADLSRSLSWEGGQLSFENEPLRSAVIRINRYARTPLVIDDPTLASVRVNGVFDAGDTDAFVEGLTALHPIRAVNRQGSLHLQRK